MRLLLICAALLSLNPAHAEPARVFQMSDFSTGAPLRDVDDEVALRLLAGAPELNLVAVGASYGNLGLKDSIRIAERAILRSSAPGTPWFAGAAGSRDRGHPTPASSALISELRRARQDGVPLTVLMLGPATDVATAIATLQQEEPALLGSLERIIAVGGGRITPDSDTGIEDVGGGPIARFWSWIGYDLNFDKDRAAWQFLLERTTVPLTLISWDAIQGTWITPRDVEALARSGGVPPALLQAMRSRASYWVGVMGLPGFPPYDAVATAFTLWPELFEVDELPLRILEKRERAFPWRKRTILRAGFQRGEDPALWDSSRRCTFVRLAPDDAAAVKSRMLGRI